MLEVAVRRELAGANSTRRHRERKADGRARRNSSNGSVVLAVRLSRAGGLKDGINSGVTEEAWSAGADAAIEEPKKRSNGGGFVAAAGIDE